MIQKQVVKTGHLFYSWSTYSARFELLHYKISPELHSKPHRQGCPEGSMWSKGFWRIMTALFIKKVMWCGLRQVQNINLIKKKAVPLLFSWNCMTNKLIKLDHFHFILSGSRFLIIRRHSKIFFFCRNHENVDLWKMRHSQVLLELYRVGYSSALIFHANFLNQAFIHP